MSVMRTPDGMESTFKLSCSGLVLCEEKELAHPRSTPSKRAQSTVGPSAAVASCTGPLSPSSLDAAQVRWRRAAVRTSRKCVQGRSCHQPPQLPTPHRGAKILVDRMGSHVGRPARRVNGPSNSPIVQHISHVPCKGRALPHAAPHPDPSHQMRLGHSHPVAVSRTVRMPHVSAVPVPLVVWDWVRMRQRRHGVQLGCEPKSPG